MAATGKFFPLFTAPLFGQVIDNLNERKCRSISQESQWRSNLAAEATWPKGVEIVHEMGEGANIGRAFTYRGAQLEHWPRSARPADGRGLLSDACAEADPAMLAVKPVWKEDLRELRRFIGL